LKSVVLPEFGLPISPRRRSAVAAVSRRSDRLNGGVSSSGELVLALARRGSKPGAFRAAIGFDAHAHAAGVDTTQAQAVAPQLIEARVAERGAAEGANPRVREEPEILEAPAGGVARVDPHDLAERARCQIVETGLEGARSRIEIVFHFGGA